LLDRMVPRELIERPKAGFAIPVGEWIKGALRPWAEDLLDPTRMRAEGLLDPEIVQRRWQDHLRGRRDSSPALWALLMFQAWVREQRGATGAAACPTVRTRAFKKRRKTEKTVSVNRNFVMDY